ncbi:TrkA-N [Sulfurimonas denitrificans DSM 1251]|jgi:Trk K+ transport system NAD-binding subunit|uniref:TrkA-N n=1 Tax=Sulfurimonas denitrificans (strain ATCC 33889 / DSM 1251) TaxID=326298 RepID=Q30QX2_SULDN|nr:NAD-binding protein [Sulfurimonas denitrificans]ABB44609.1 TrkA-N [Sulfurimonas denitrificans DSM 1251]
MHKIALIFGHNDYTFEIEKNIKSHYKKIYIFELDEQGGSKESNGYEIQTFDLSEDWDELREIVNIDECEAFCILEEMSKNIFLTLSLRDTFENLKIVALSQDKESTDKLILAGASKILPTTQTTANIIVEMIKKPIVTEVLHNILYEKSNLKIAQVMVKNAQYFNGIYSSDVDWSKEYNITVLSVIDEEGDTEFIYSAKAKHQQIKNGYQFVVVGFDIDIIEFEKLIGGANE